MVFKKVHDAQMSHVFDCMVFKGWNSQLCNLKLLILKFLSLLLTFSMNSRFDCPIAY